MWGLGKGPVSCNAAHRPVLRASAVPQTGGPGELAVESRWAGNGRVRVETKGRQN